MADNQKRFWNWQDEDSTSDLNNWLQGILEAGLYRGFDPTGMQGMTLTLSHQTTGAIRTKGDKTLQDKFGVVMTKQGVVINQLDPVSFEIEPTTNDKRVDIVVLEHEYKELIGGIVATYKVLKEAGNSTPPQLTSPSTQVILGYLTLPPNCTDLTKATYVRATMPTLGNNKDFVEKDGGFIISNLDAKDNQIINLGEPTQNSSAATKLYVDTAISRSIVNATETQRGVARLATKQETEQGVNDTTIVTPLKAKHLLDTNTANQQEVIDGGNNKLVTAKTLQNKVATETQKGISKIATEREVIDGTDDSSIVTPFKLHKVLGYTQKIIEIGKWDLNSSDEIEIAHTHEWWNKVVAIDLCLVDNTLVRYHLGATAKLTNDKLHIKVNKAAAPHINFASFGGSSLNRGYAVFTIKNDIVQPNSTISVNAGADQVYEKMFLGLGKPTIRKAKYYRNMTHPQIFLLSLEYTLGQGLDMGSVRLQYKLDELSTDWHTNDSTYPSGLIIDLSEDIGGSLSDLSVRLQVQVGSEYVYSDAVTFETKVVEADRIVEKELNTEDNTQITKDKYEVNGFVQAIGSNIASRNWELVTGDGTIENHGDKAYFTPNTFGEHTLRFTATNEQGLSATDDMVINIKQKLNKKPIAKLLFTATNSANDWTSEIPLLPNGSRPIGVKADTSTDEDGYIIAYEYQVKFPNGEWSYYLPSSWLVARARFGLGGGFWGGRRFINPYLLFANAMIDNSFINVETSHIESGLIQFRCRVMDNYGVWSEWSNELRLNLLQTALKRLDTFSLNVLSTSPSAFQSQLSIIPIDKVAKLEMKINYSKTGRGSNQKFPADITLIVGSSYREYIGGFDGIKTIDLTQHRASLMNINMNLHYSAGNQRFFGEENVRIVYNFTITAYDKQGREIGSVTQVSS